MNIYISSTNDLQEYREEVQLFLLNGGLNIITGGGLTASHLPNLQSNKDGINNADVIIFLVGHHLNRSKCGNDISLLEADYESAKKKAYSPLFFLYDADSPWPVNLRTTFDASVSIETFHQDAI